MFAGTMNRHCSISRAIERVSQSLTVTCSPFQGLFLVYGHRESEAHAAGLDAA